MALFAFMRRESQIDLNDLLYVTERRGNPLASYPAPISMYKGELKINPHVSRFQYLNEKGEVELTDVFHVKPVYYQTVDGFWRPMSEICSYHGNKRIDLKEGWDQMVDLRFLAWLVKRAELIKGRVSIPVMPTRLMPLSLVPKQDYAEIYLTTTTYYPDADPETTTVDGYTGRVSVNEAWSTFWQAAGNTANDSSSAQEQLMALSDSTGTNWKHIIRSIFLFDTSGIGDTDLVSAATLSCWVADHGTTVVGDLDVSVVSSNPASNTAITSSDHTSCGTTKYATDVAISSMSNGAYKDWTLNSTGRSAVSTTGVTKLAIRWAKDIDSPSTFNSPGSNANRTFFEGFYAEKTGTSNDPKLAVTYAPITTKTCSETGTFTDTALKTPGKVLSETVTDTDTLLKKPVRTLSETVTHTEERTTLRVVSILLSETGTNTDTSILKVVGKVISETTTFSDSVLKFLARIFAETATHTDTLLRIPGKILSEGATYTEDIKKQITGRILNDSSSFSDTLLKMPNKVLSETVTNTDTKILHITYGVSPVETAHFTETILAVSTLQRILVESASFADINVTLAGVWIPRTKPSTSWTQRTKPVNVP